MFGCRLGYGSLASLSLCTHFHATLCSPSPSLWLLNRLSHKFLGLCFLLTANLVALLLHCFRICLRLCQIFDGTRYLSSCHRVDLLGLRSRSWFFPRGDRNGLLRFNSLLLDYFNFRDLFSLWLTFWLRFFLGRDWFFRDLNLNFARITICCYFRKNLHSRWSFIS